MAKRVPPLSAAKLAKLKPDPTKTLELVDGAVPGLRIRITPAGTKTWSLNMRAHGVMRRFEVGSELGLSDARAKALDLRKLIKEGADPTQDRRNKRLQATSAKIGIGTLESVIDAYFSSPSGRALRTGGEQSRRVKSVFASHMQRPAGEVTSAQLQLTIDAHQSASSAARATAYLKPILKWARKRGLVSDTFDLEKPPEGAPKQRHFTDDELAALWPTLSGPYGNCVKFLLYTGVRLSSAVNATWGQVDLLKGIWTIPGGSLKDTRRAEKRGKKPKTDLLVPLSKQAQALLSEVRQAEVARRQMRGDGRDVALDDRVFVGDRGGRLANWDRWLKSNDERSGVNDWSAKACRSTVATLAANCGAPPHIASVIMGHANIGGQLLAVYNKGRYFTEHAEALQAVGDKLDAIVGTVERGATR